MVLIFRLSSESHPLPHVTAVVWDKLLHSVEYAALGLLLCRALLGEGLSVVRAVVFAVVVTSAYGASDEWHQAFVPERSSDVKDWVTDNIGATLGASMYAAALGRRTSRRRELSA